mgnify:CR=1 FL=1
MEQVPSGIKGLDELLGGGIPHGRCVLVVGSPGSGKTTLSMQFLHSGAIHDEPSLYITLDEKPEHLKENLSIFGWGLDELERKGVLLLYDATFLRKAKRGVSASEREGGLSIRESTLEGLVQTVQNIVREEGIQRVVVDPITSLMLHYESLCKRRRAVLTFFDALIETGCTSIVTTELRTGILKRKFQLEEFLSQGVILLHTLIHGGNVVRAIQIEKMRGIAHDTQLRPYQIGKSGIEVFQKDRVF